MRNLGAEYENLDYKAYQVIKDMIIDRQFLPGQKIPQEKLATDLGISRTPLVNALKYLEHEKLIKAIPRRGYFVRLFTQQEMISIFELREVLEGLAARRACDQISDTGIKRLKSFFSIGKINFCHQTFKGMSSASPLIIVMAAWVWVLINPGMTNLPWASIVFFALYLVFGEISTIFEPEIARSAFS